MAKLPLNFEFGYPEELTQEQLLDLLKKMYRDLADAINKKPDLIERAEDGQTSDDFLSRGTLNLNTTSGKVEMLTNFTEPRTDPETVTWTQLS